MLGFNLIDWGRLDEGLAEYECSLDHARAVGNRRRQVWSLGLGAWGLLAADRLPQADRWLAECLALVDDVRWVAFRPWPVAVLSESHLRQGTSPAELRPRLEEAFALSCQFQDPCWEAAIARVLALSFAVDHQPATAMTWLAEARRRCFRNTDGYAALQVEILANLVEISRDQGNPAQADALAREWIAAAARAHMDRHVARAAAFIGR